MRAARPLAPKAIGAIAASVIAIAASCARQEQPSRGSTSPLDVIRRTGALSRHLGEGEQLIETAAGYRLAAVDRGGLDVTLPLDARGAMRIAIAGHAELFVEVSSEQRAKVRPTIVGGASVMADVLPDLDLVQIVEPGRIEELEVLRSARAPTTTRSRLKLAPSLHARARDHRIEVVDRDGRLVLQTEPIFAVDARGVRRDAEVTLQGDDVVITLPIEGLAFPVVLDPAWTTTASMATARKGHTATLLSSGKVLVVGGVDGAGSYTSTAELYDPSSRTWSSAGAMSIPRVFHAAALVGVDVLVTGGLGPVGVTSSAELYDETLGWSVTAPMKTPREGHTATTIAVDRVVVHGGARDAFDATSIVASTEQYALATHSFNTLTNAHEARAGHEAVALVDGTILVVGGEEVIGGVRRPVPTSEIFDSVSGTWGGVMYMSYARLGHRLTLLTDGRVLASGGIAGGVEEIFNPPTKSWSYTSTTISHSYHSATRLPSGRVLLAGGIAGSSVLSQAVLYDPVGRAIPAGELVTGRAYHTATALSSGAIVVAGGQDFAGAVLSSAELFLPIASGACASDGECASGFCSYGVCCDAPCGGGCQSCSVPGKMGICSMVDDGPPPRASACSPYLRCVAGACSLTCDVDADCIPSFYCAASRCVPRRPLGSSPCTDGRECVSSSCVDSVCCTTSSCAAGEHCNLPGYYGTCHKGSGAPCAVPRDCPSGACVDGVCCDSPCNGDCQACDLPDHVGTCGVVVAGPPHGRRSCAPFNACVAGRCAATCASDADCTPRDYCDDTSHACQARRENGAACAFDRGCASGHCVDAICCDTACSDVCAACDVEGSRGACTKVDHAAPHGKRACAEGPCAWCDGKDSARCAAAARVGTVCGASTCASARLTTVRCDGAGACRSSTEECAPFGCDGDACASTCVSDEQCGKGASCLGGACVPNPRCSDDGATTIAHDGGVASCAPYRCVDGACPRRCSGNEQCAAGGSCRDGRCALDAPASGCGCRAARSESNGSIVALTIVAILAGRRRRARATLRSALLRARSWW